MNPFDALATFVLGKIKEGLYAQWLKFLFELGFSGLLGFLFGTGASLLKTRSWPIGIGTGLISCAVCLLALFGKERSKLTRGMIIVFPGELAAKQIEASLNTEEKPEK